MKKKIKLEIKDLKVQSFVTNINPEEKKDLKGGAMETLKDLCNGGTLSQYHSFCHTCEFQCGI